MDTTKFAEQLQSERERLINELSTIAEPKPGTPGEWQATPETSAMDRREDVAEEFEELEERRATEHNLEIRLKEVESALAKISAGTYGVCEIGDEPIELDRLEANPAARTCKTHLDSFNGR